MTLNFWSFFPHFLSFGIKLIVQHYIQFICYGILHQVLLMNLEDIDSTELYLKSYFLYVETLLEFSCISEMEIKLCTTYIIWPSIHTTQWIMMNFQAILLNRNKIVGKATNDKENIWLNIGLLLNYLIALCSSKFY